MALDGSDLRLENPTQGPPLTGAANYNGLATHPTTGNLLLCDRAGHFFFLDHDAQRSFPVAQSQIFRDCECCFSPDGNWLVFSAGLTDLYKSGFHFDGSQVVIDPPVRLSQAGSGETPSMGMDPDTVYYQRRTSPTSRRLARSSLSLNRYTDISRAGGGTEDEDDCCITTFPETVVP